MKRSRFTEEQIAHILRQAESGVPVADLIRKHAVSEQTFYRWKKKYGGMGQDQCRSQPVSLIFSLSRITGSRPEVASEEEIKSPYNGSLEIEHFEGALRAAVRARTGGGR